MIHIIEKKRIKLIAIDMLQKVKVLKNKKLKEIPHLTVKNELK
jgi:hypothetical protein